MTPTEKLSSVIVTAVKATNGPLLERIVALEARAAVPGPAGERGERGLDGAPGAAGPAGEKGADGQFGNTGPTGPTGERGADGLDGKDGAPGPQGARGDSGPAGQDGRDGLDGKDADVETLRSVLALELSAQVAEAVKALPVPDVLADDVIADTVAALCQKAFEPYRLPPVQWQKRVVRDGLGRVESVVEEPVS